ncbi:MAG: FtsB family cell division protein [Planctomycetota bacterium]|jgi:hypothetical protein
MLLGHRGHGPNDSDSPAGRLGDALAFWAVAAFCIFLFFISYWIPATRKFRALKREEKNLAVEIQDLQQANARLESRLRALYDDPYYVERVLRSEHGFLKDGERKLKPKTRKLEE